MLGLLTGYVLTRLGFYALCHYGGHNVQEELFSGWATMIYTVGFGVVGLTLGRSDRSSEKSLSTVARSKETA
ncbi:hypothetical protein EV286_12217 [Rhizobium sp. BK251]|nr:hypothetical protein EV286_12217 [Rhizobium sp. BK251]